MYRHLLKVSGILVILFTLLGGLVANAQNRTVKGTVLDEGNQPVIGAVVMVVGNDRIATMTDAAGAFSLNVPAGANLTVESMGYVSQTFAVGN